MSFVDRVKRFFTQTITSDGDVTNESNPDWHVIAKRMMYDVVVFNSEMFDLERCIEVGSSPHHANNERDNQSSAKL